MWLPLLWAALPLAAGSPVPEFEVSLDRAPEERFSDVVEHFRDEIHTFIEHIRGESLFVRAFTGLVAKYRGPENDEFQREIEGVSKLAGVPLGEIHALQLLSEVATLMVPVVNFTSTGHFGSQLPSALPAPFHFGCMGIVATDRQDGTVYHGRNLDFSFARYLQKVVYTAIFTRNGTEVFRAQTIAGYSSILTGMRKGPNGFTIEINTRYPDHVGGNEEMLGNLFRQRRELSGWTRRKILEQHDNYEDAVAALSTTPYVATEYNIVSGVRKGVVLARNPDGLAFSLPLENSTSDYVIMSNFDYPWHDVREVFDPTTVKGIFHPRRLEAEKLLDNASTIGPQVLSAVLSDDGVMAKDTIFQVIMNVEKGLWNATLPSCVLCGDSQLFV